MATEPHGMSRAGAAAFGSLSVLVPALLSRGDAPGASNPSLALWYASLRKPPFNPPKVVFPVAWSLLDGLLALSAYRVARHRSHHHPNRSLVLWLANVAAISTWSKLFFKQRALGASALAAGAMVPLGVSYVVAATKVDKPAALQATPYVGWLLFASALSTSIWLLNRGR